jgi:hypothetical protein
MGLGTRSNNISEVLFLLQKYKQKMITHNGDNYTNKVYNMIYIYKNKVSKKQKQTKTKQKNNIDWSEYASTLVKALGASNKIINSREDFDVLIRSLIFITS